MHIEIRNSTMPPGFWLFIHDGVACCQGEDWCSEHFKNPNLAIEQAWIHYQLGKAEQAPLWPTLDQSKKL